MDVGTYRGEVLFLIIVIVWPVGHIEGMLSVVGEGATLRRCFLFGRWAIYESPRSHAVFIWLKSTLLLWCYSSEYMYGSTYVVSQVNAISLSRANAVENWTLWVSAEPYRTVSPKP